MARRILVGLLGLLLLAPAAALADCSDGEITAVFLVSGLYEGVNVQIDVIDAAPVGDVYNPSEWEQIEAIREVIPEYGLWFGGDAAGPFVSYWAPVSDFGAVGIVDGRDCRVVFAGTVVWSGTGEVRLPLEDSHPWSVPGGEAPPPMQTQYIGNEFWDDGFMTQAAMTEAALGVMRRTDVLQSFAACDDYSVISFIYTPTVGITDPNAAVCVVIVSGRCGPPWNDETVATDGDTWSGVRALFD